MVYVNCIIGPEISISLDCCMKVIEMVQEWNIVKMEVRFMKDFIEMVVEHPISS